MVTTSRRRGWICNGLASSVFIAAAGLAATPPCGTTIETVAGGGGVGDGGVARAARLSMPGGVVVAPNGDLIIVDFGNHRVRRVGRRSGTITTIAGTGEPGFSGDGGPASRARIARPESAAFDPRGNLFIVDSHNHRIRRIDAALGTITTVAGTGHPGFGGDGGPARAAMLYQPEGIAFLRDGSFYIGDTLNGRVRRVDGRTGVITTVAGDGSIGVSPSGTPALRTSFLRIARVAVDPNDDLWIADSPAHTIQRLDRRDGTLRVMAGTGEEGFSGDGGPAAASRLSYPEGLAFDPAGNLYFADLGNHRVRRIDRRTRIIETIGGTGERGFSGDGGSARAARFWSPGRIAVDRRGLVYVADILNARIRKIELDGTVRTVAGSGTLGDGGPARAALLAIPGDVIWRDGALFVAEFGNRRVRRIDLVAGTITTVAGGGMASENGAPAIGFDIKLPEAVASDERGNLYIADSLGHSVWKVDAAAGTISRIAGTGEAGRGRDGIAAVESPLHMPGAIAVTSDGMHIFISDFGNQRIRVAAAGGTMDTLAVRDRMGKLVPTPAVSLALDDDVLYWLESGDAHLYSMRLDGGGLRESVMVPLPPRPNPDEKAFQFGDLAVAGRRAYLADTLGHRVLRFDLDSRSVDVVAGCGRQGFGGDGGDAADASLFRPGAVALNDRGDLFIADSFNHRVRVVHLDGDCRGTR